MPMLCPRCEINEFVTSTSDPDYLPGQTGPLQRPARSRVCNAAICTECGEDEALLPLIGRFAPRSLWPLPAASMFPLVRPTA